MGATYGQFPKLRVLVLAHTRIVLHIEVLSRVNWWGMVQLDFLTLYIVIFLNSLTVCVIWAAIVAMHRDFVPSQIWFISVLLAVVGGLVLSIQGNEGAFWPAVIGNTIVIYSFCLAWVGARYFYGGNGGWKTALIVSAASFAFMSLFYSSWQGRNVVYAVGQSIPMAMTAAYLLKQRRVGLGGGIALSAILLGIGGHGIETFLNLAAWAGHYDQQLYIAVESYALVCVIYSGVVWHFGFIVMAVNRLHGDVLKVAQTDELTNLPNRRHFMGRLAQAEREFSEGGKPYSVMMIDIDHFKQWNDQYGHSVGDQVLSHFANVASDVVRGSDVLARTGGDEFSLLMPGTEEAEAVKLARGLVALIRRSSFSYDGKSLDMSVSIGIATRTASDARADIDVLARADMALYRVKQAGRDGYATLTTTIVGQDLVALRMRDWIPQ